MIIVLAIFAITATLCMVACTAGFFNTMYESYIVIEEVV